MHYLKTTTTGMAVVKADPWGAASSGARVINVRFPCFEEITVLSLSLTGKLQLKMFNHLPTKKETAIAIVYWDDNHCLVGNGYRLWKKYMLERDHLTPSWDSATLESFSDDKVWISCKEKNPSSVFSWASLCLEPLSATDPSYNSKKKKGGKNVAASIHFYQPPYALSSSVESSF